jgi:trk system potassium uptake protein TrkH
VSYAIFHAVSAFCNAGFDIFERGVHHYAGDPVVNLVFVALIVMGGLGFPVLVNLYYYRRSGHLTLHSKLVLVTYAIFVMVGIVSVALLEWTNPHTLGGAPIGTRLLESLFQGVTPRTAGFATVNYSDMHDSTVLMQIILMFIGTAPASTGGIKVTTLAFIYLILLCQVRRETEVSVFRRRIPPTLVAKTLSVLALASVLVIAGSIALVASEGLPLQVAMFEVTSALGTVGLSLGPTPDLSPFGKLLIIFLMFVGRLGPITLILALSQRSRPKGYAYPQEEIAIG